jgi:hypothetical protein
MYEPTYLFSPSIVRCAALRRIPIHSGRDVL